MEPVNTLQSMGSVFAPIRTHPWAYPALEVGHILGIALLVGNLVLLEFRVWGSSPLLPVRELARLSLSVALAGFALAGATGLLMFASQAGELMTNRAFTLKIFLLITAGCNAAWFHGRDSLGKLDAMAKAQTLVSTLLWVAIMACGRAIAYI